VSLTTNVQCTLPRPSNQGSVDPIKDGLPGAPWAKDKCYVGGGMGRSGIHISGAVLKKTTPINKDEIYGDDIMREGYRAGVTRDSESRETMTSRDLNNITRDG
jgi:hypothetical protein